MLFINIEVTKEMVQKVKMGSPGSETQGWKRKLLKYK